MQEEGEKDKKEDEKEQPESSIRPKLQRASQVLFSITTIMFFTQLFLDYFGSVPENEILVNIIDFYPKSCMLMHLNVVIREFFDVLQIPYNEYLLVISMCAGPFIWIELAGNPTRAERQHGSTIFYLMLVLFIFYLLVWFYSNREKIFFKEEDTRMRTFLYRVRGKAKMITDTFQVVVEPVYKASPDWLKRLGHGSWNSLKRVLTGTTNELPGTSQSEVTQRAKETVKLTCKSQGGVPKETNPKESVFKKVVKFLSPFCQKVPYASFGAVILSILCYGFIFVMRHIGKLEY
uniref:Uncharacterized protein n=1 Tax=Acrobeloides nanus TaxID=290746 RepID=A0A914D5Q5_9BILA